jgi:hypothetical protein
VIKGPLTRSKISILAPTKSQGSLLNKIGHLSFAICHFESRNLRSKKWQMINDKWQIVLSSLRLCHPNL